jgi:hypothetical protein
MVRGLTGSPWPFQPGAVFGDIMLAWVRAVYDLEPCPETATAQKPVLRSLDEKCTSHADGSTDLLFGPTAQVTRAIPTETLISV